MASLLAERSPIVIDVALASWGKSLPGAIGLQGTGYGSEFSSAVQERFQRKVVELTKGDLTASVIALCANAERLTAYNLAVRLVEVGHTNVYWYRGGLEGWRASNLPCHDLTLQEW